ncbi:hypothetical protein GCM10011390_41520 [Aureimonas endophytica]|uniref:Uncharacterized protein n=1 Tax=Aureimonas endophytica TaxID=2027858 RepID=A0A917EB84_9HYPH|nr:hypothetical protein [Aureimonas endophytica]GGE18037.1 hypothetical protein GCM10011390_41520 [Aureimonas endophytica]
MRLIPDWRRVLARAWSIRFNALAFLLSMAEVAISYLNGYLPIPPGAFAALAGLISGAAFVARLVAQRGITRCP